MDIEAATDALPESGTTSSHPTGPLHSSTRRIGPTAARRWARLRRRASLRHANGNKLVGNPARASDVPASGRDARLDAARDVRRACSSATGPCGFRRYACSRMVSSARRRRLRGGLAQLMDRVRPHRRRGPAGFRNASKTGAQDRAWTASYDERHESGFRPSARNKVTQGGEGRRRRQTRGVRERTSSRTMTCFSSE